MAGHGFRHPLTSDIIVSVSPPGPSGALTRSVASNSGVGAIATQSNGLEPLRPSSAPSPWLQGRPGPSPEARTPHVLDVSGPGALGGDFQLPRIEADVGTLLDLIEDGNLRMGVGLRPGARLGLGVRVPQSESSSSRPDLWVNAGFRIEQGRWLTDARRPADQPWLGHDSQGQRTLLSLTDAEGRPAELDGPFIFDPERLYLEERDGESRIFADVQCFPDPDVTRMLTGQDTLAADSVGDLARAFLPDPVVLSPGQTSQPPSAASAVSTPSALDSPEARRVMDAVMRDSLRVFDATGTLRPGPLRLGSGPRAQDGVFLNLTAGSSVRVSGDLDEMVAHIDARFSSLDLSSGDSRIYSGEGRAQIEVVTRFRRGEDGEIDFSRRPSVEIRLAQLDARGVNLTLPGPRGARQQLRVGHLVSSDTSGPSLSLIDGQTHINLQDVDLYDAHGALQVDGSSSQIQLGRSNRAGDGADIENVSLRYSSTRGEIELSGEPVDFSARVGTMELIDGQIAGVGLDVSLGEGTIDIPGRSRFHYRSGAQSLLELEALDPEHRWSFSGEIAEFQLGRSASSSPADAETLLAEYANDVSFDLASGTQGVIAGRRLSLRPGQLPVLEDLSIDLDVEVDELAFPAGLERPVRFVGGTGGELHLQLDRLEGERFFRGSGHFDASFGGAALARAQRIRGLEDALLDFNAEGNGARISGEIEFDPTGGIRLEPRFSGQPSVSIAMQRGTIDDTSALDDTEPRHTPLEPHRPLVLDRPRDAETSPRQTPLDLDIGDAISAFIDDGRISIEVPTRAGSTGPIGDAEDAQISDIHVAEGTLTVDLVLEGENENSRLSTEHSRIVIDPPITIDVNFGGLSVNLSEIGFEETSNGHVQLAPNIDFERILGSEWLADINNWSPIYRYALTRLARGALSDMLFQASSLPGDRDALLAALEDGPLGGNLAITDLDEQLRDLAPPASTPRRDREPDPEAPLVLAAQNVVTPPTPPDAQTDDSVVEPSSGRAAQLGDALDIAQRVFELDRARLVLGDDDGHGPLELAGRRLDLGGGQFVDFAEGSELDVTVDAVHGLVVSGRAILDGLQIGSANDAKHVAMGASEANVELRVAPGVDGTPVIEIAMSHVTGVVDRLRGSLPDGAMELQNVVLGAEDNNVVMFRSGGEEDQGLRFHLPDLDRATVSYHNGLGAIRPQWDDARIDIRRAEISDADLFFDGRELIAEQPLMVENLEAYISNIEEEPFPGRQVRLARTRLSGSGTVLLGPDGSLQLNGDVDDDPETAPTLAIEASADAFDLVTTGPEATLPIKAGGTLSGALNSLSFSHQEGTEFALSNMTFRGAFDEGEVVVGPEQSEFEKMRVSNGLIWAHSDRLEFGSGVGGSPRLYIDASYNIDADFASQLPLSEIDSEYLRAAGITVRARGAYSGRVRVSGAVLYEDNDVIIDSHAVFDIEAEGEVEATGIRPPTIRERVNRWFEDILMQPPR